MADEQQSDSAQPPPPPQKRSPARFALRVALVAAATFAIWRFAYLRVALVEAFTGQHCVVGVAIGLGLFALSGVVSKYLRDEALRNRDGTDQDHNCAAKRGGVMCDMGCEWIDKNGFDSNKECGCRTCPKCIWVKHDDQGYRLPREKRKCVSRSAYAGHTAYASIYESTVAEAAAEEAARADTYASATGTTVAAGDDESTGGDDGSTAGRVEPRYTEEQEKEATAQAALRLKRAREQRAEQARAWWDPLGILTGGSW